MRLGFDAGGICQVKGIGTDIVSVARLEASLERTRTFAEEVYTESERVHCRAQRHQARHFAACFAAKEAFLKAVGVGIFGGVALRDVEVAHAGPGQPSLRLGPSAAAALARRDATRSLLSLAHQREYAIAVVVIT